MGLFDNLLGRSSIAKLDVQQAVMVILVAAVKVDGGIEEKEVQQIRSICCWSPLFSRNSSAQDDVLINFANTFTDSEGLESAITHAAAALAQPLRETSFCFAARIAFADGYLGVKEKEFISNLTTWLSIDQVRARQIIEVVSIMNHDITVE